MAIVQSSQMEISPTHRHGFWAGKFPSNTHATPYPAISQLAKNLLEVWGRYSLTQTFHVNVMGCHMSSTRTGHWVDLYEPASHALFNKKLQNPSAPVLIPQRSSGPPCSIGSDYPFGNGCCCLL